MKREIKFRGKGFLDNKWYYGFYQESDNSEYSFITGQDVAHVYSDTVGQFIGKEDCLGNEIYEGDVLKTCFHIDECECDSFVLVKWDDELCGFCVVEKGANIPGEIDFLDEYQVVGNIHDNPELEKMFEQGEQK